MTSSPLGPSDLDDLPGRSAGSDGGLPLASWRQLDWRFLLPRLGPYRLAFNASSPPELRAALVTVDPTATVFAPSTTTVDSDPTPLIVVLSSPTAVEFEVAAHALRPGDFLYALVSRDLALRTGAPRSVRGWGRFARQLGIGPVRLFWHAPDFQRCARIVALDSRAAMWNTLERHQGVPFGRAASAAGKLAFRLGVFGWAVSHAGVLLSRPDAGG